MALSCSERARLKARAHALEPVVRIGHAGVTAEVVAEVDRALSAHELIKVSIAMDREERASSGSTLVAVRARIQLAMTLYWARRHMSSS